MLDPEKISRCQHYFTEWRGESVANTEEPLFKNALLHLEEIESVTHADGHLFSHDKPFQHFGGNPSLHTFSLLLFVILTLKEYQYQCQHGGAYGLGEEKLLQSLVSNLESVYQHPTVHPVDKFNSFIALSSQWLSEGLIKNSNLQLAKKTLLSFFAVLQQMSSQIEHAGFAEQVALRAMFMGQKAPKISIDALIAEASSKFKELEIIHAPLEQIKSNEPPTAVTLLSVDDYFYSNQLIIFLSDLPLYEKFDQVKSQLTQIRAMLTELIAERSIEESIQTAIQETLLVLHAIDTNEAKGVNKQNIREFIQENQDIINAMMSKKSESEQRQWSIEVEKLNVRTRKQIVLDYGLSFVRWVTYVPRLILVSLTPQSIQDWISQLKPAQSPDPLQIRLKQLAHTRLQYLQNSLSTSQGKKTRIIQSLDEKTDNIKTLLLQATTHQLQEILDKNLAIHQLFVDFEIFSTKIIQNRKKLQLIVELDAQTEQFVEDHNSFFVQLSIFIANLCNLFSVFKTDMAVKMEEIQTIKTELQVLKKGYEQTVTKCFNAIMQHPSASSKLKKTILDLIPEQRLAPKPVPQNSLKAYSLVKTLFNQLKAPPAPEENATLNIGP